MSEPNGLGRVCTTLLFKSMLAKVRPLPFQQRRTNALSHEEHLLLEAAVKRFRREAAKYVGLTVKDRQKVPYDRWCRARFPAKQLDKAQISRHFVDAALGDIALYRVQIVNRLGEAGEALSADRRQIVDRMMEDVVADDGMQSDVGRARFDQ